MVDAKANENVVKLDDVRLTFPALFVAKPNQNGKLKYQGSFIFPPIHPAVAIIKAAMAKVAKEKWGDKAEEVYKGLKASDRLVLHDGDAKSQFGGYAGNIYVNASSETRPLVIDGNKAPLTATDGKPYSGCYVNARVQIWAQDNPQFGKRINASLMGVQFLRDGERLAGSAVARAEDFEAIPDAPGAAAAGAGAGSVFD